MENGLQINPSTFAPAKITNLGTILNVILPLLQAGAALLFLATLLQAGFIWITAGDKPENIAKARKKIFFAIIGLLIVVLSFVFVKIIGYMLQINMPL
jgi:hypothetical protein